MCVWKLVLKLQSFILNICTILQSLFYKFLMQLFQGPAKYTIDDIKMLQLQLHHYFFARKFSTDQSDPAREAVLHMVSSNSYGREVHHNMPKPLLQSVNVWYI